MKALCTKNVIKSLFMFLLCDNAKPEFCRNVTDCTNKIDASIALFGDNKCEKEQVGRILKKSRTIVKLVPLARDGTYLIVAIILTLWWTVNPAEP